MSVWGPALLLAAVTALVFVGMWLGWRRRSRVGTGLGLAHEPPTTPGERLCRVDAFYAATTRHDAPLERVAAPGLGFPGRARVSVFATGILLVIPGELPVFVGRDDLVGVGAATWTIDRAVERDGLLVVTWRARRGGEPELLDSYLRVVDLGERRRLTASIDNLLGAAGAEPTTVGA